MSWPDLRALQRNRGRWWALTLLEATAELSVASYRVKRGGPGLSQLLRPPAATPDTDPVAQGPLDEVAWAIHAVGRRLPRDPTCLMRALAARAMLARRGIGSRIHIGISEDAKDFHAHAWVEVGTRPVVGWIAGERFRVLAQIR